MSGEICQFKFEAIGTSWIIDIYQEESTIEKDKVNRAILDLVARFDLTYSRFRKDSLVYNLAKKTGKLKVTSEFKLLLDTYWKLYNLTNGIFTPLIGRALEQAGYNEEYSLQPNFIEQVPSWEEVILYNYPDLEIKQPCMLDFGAAGKGYLVDLIGELVSSFGVKNFCIDGSGDILYRNNSKNSIKIGLENPVKTNQVIGIANLLNKSLCASAGNRRKWANFTHILNPKTLTSPKNILATWVVSDTGLVADAIATCLFFVGPEMLSKEFQFDHLVMYNDFTVDKSVNFPAELFFD